MKHLPHKEILDLSHHNTLFSQTLSFIPRHIFQKLEHRHKAGRSSRKFGFKEQFTVMAFIQLAARRSMRDGLRCLEAVGNRLYHWGLKNVARSTFADANKSRPVDFFKDLFAQMCHLCAAKASKHKFRFKSKLFSLDATTIKLCLSLFPRASFRQTKGGVKIHTLLDHDGSIPAFATVTEAKAHESRIAHTLELPKGSIVVFHQLSLVPDSWGKEHLLCDPSQTQYRLQTPRASSRESQDRHHFRSHHCGQQPGKNSAPASHRLPGAGNRKALRVFDQSFPAFGENHRRPL